MDRKSYVDIERVKEKYVGVFTLGERIVIQEKVDGSNASFTFDSKTGEIVAFSRRKTLDSTNTLNGFWNWTQTLNKEKVDSITEHGRYIIFGEWLTKHSVKYPDCRYGKFYMFDVWDTYKEQYISIGEAESIFTCLEAYGPVENPINFVPIFYIGEFKGWEHIKEFVGLSCIGASPCGEGIVIKSQDRLGDKNSRIPKYLKFVSEKFSEIHDTKKPVDPQKLAEKEREKLEVQSIVTDRRIEKCLQKLIEDQIIPESWDEHDMPTIARNLPTAVYKDCVKEEPEFVQKYSNFGKICGGLTMQYVKGVLNEKNV